MKLALTSYYDISPKQVKIVREKGMKPYFKYNQESRAQIHFNVSHDGDIVVIILSKHEVGIDIMKSELPLRNKQSNSNLEEAKEKFLSHMKSVFHPSEWGYIQKDISKFMHYWTIKESFVKYIGLGLYIDPRRLLIGSDEIRKSPSNSPKSGSLGKSSIYMDNQIQKCKIYSSNQIIPNYYISFCISENCSKRSFCSSRSQIENAEKEVKSKLTYLSKEAKMEINADYEVLSETESMSILRPRFPTHVVTKQGIELRSSSYGVEDREGNLGELLAVTQITGVVYMTFDSLGRLYSIKKDVAREFLGELQDERMNWE